MCGIGCFIGCDEATLSYHEAEIKDKLDARGPDCFSSARLGENGVLFASVHAIRGAVTSQPLRSTSGNLLCFNGEVFGGLEIPANDNDTRHVLDAIERDGLETTLHRLTGPFALAYFETAAKTLFVCRDVIGRRSLLYQQLEQGLYIGSIALNDACEAIELQCGVCFAIDLARPAEMRRVFELAPLAPLADGSAMLKEPTRDELTLATDKLCNALRAAVRTRLDTLPAPKTKDEARIAILFSGGLDSAVLACLAGQLIGSDEPIDLINVAFESPRVLRGLPDGTSPFDTPDRLTCRSTLDVLRKLQPSVRWRLLEIDVPFDQAEAARPKVLSLIRPCTSEMDLSIGLALYFAASAPTAAKALMSGLGADEILGGYSRHRRCFTKDGWLGLAAEMQLDLDRIGTRNLGRDDRCISAHGKEARYPFLDEHLLAFVSSLPLVVRCDLRIGEGVGDKRLLRLVAANLGLVEVAQLPKRAMQFGSRSAKRAIGIRAGRAKGTDAVGD